MFNSWIYNVTYPKNNNEKEIINSFPMHGASEEIGMFGFWWFSLVFAGWVLYFMFYKPYINNRSNNAANK